MVIECVVIAPDLVHAPAQKGFSARDVIVKGGTLKVGDNVKLDFACVSKPKLVVDIVAPDAPVNDVKDSA